MAFRHATERLQIAERRWSHPETIRIRGLAIADDEVAEFAFRRLDRVIGLAGERLDQARHLADNRPFRNALRRLTDDAQRLAEFLEPNQVAIVGIADGSDRHVEF